MARVRSSATGTSTGAGYVDVTTPTGASAPIEGEILVLMAMVGGGSTSSAMTFPSGFTEPTASTAGNSTGGQTGRWAWKRATSSEPSTYRITGPNDYWAAALSVCEGIDGVAPLLGYSTSGVTSGSQSPTPISAPPVWLPADAAGGLALWFGFVGASSAVVTQHPGNFRRVASAQVTYANCYLAERDIQAGEFHLPWAGGLDTGHSSAGSAFQVALRPIAPASDIEIIDVQEVAGAPESSLTESATAGDASAGDLVAAAAATEDGGAAEESTSAAASAASDVEVGDATDAASSVMASASDAAESGAAAEADSCVMASAAGAAESITAADSASQTRSAVAAGEESVSASESTSAAGAAEVAATEGATAADSADASAAGEFLAAVAEALSSADIQTGQMAGTAAAAESASADSVVAGAMASAATGSEGATATEATAATNSSGSSFTATQAEAASAGHASTTIANTFAAAVATSTPIDVSNGTVGERPDEMYPLEGLAQSFPLAGQSQTYPLGD